MLAENVKHLLGSIVMIAKRGSPSTSTSVHHLYLVVISYNPPPQLSGSKGTIEGYEREDQSVSARE